MNVFIYRIVILWTKDRVLYLGLSGPEKRIEKKMRERMKYKLNNHIWNDKKPTKSYMSMADLFLPLIFSWK